jgi:inorganic pyrophosphatase
MNIWHDINPNRITPERYFGVIEIPKGSKTKYEIERRRAS